jgi:hypothetical protein
MKFKNLINLFCAKSLLLLVGQFVTIVKISGHCCGRKTVAACNQFSVKSFLDCCIAGTFVLTSLLKRGIMNNVINFY